MSSFNNGGEFRKFGVAIDSFERNLFASLKDNSLDIVGVLSIKSRLLDLLEIINEVTDGEADPDTVED